MPTYSVDDVLEIITAFTPEQKLQLQQELSQVLGLDPHQGSSPADQTSQTISGVTITGSQDVVFNQAQGQSSAQVDQSKLAANLTQKDLQKALEMLAQLKQAIATDQELNPLLKEIATDKINTLEAESKKSNPDQSLIQQTIKTLKQGLEGVTSLAGPVTKVADLLAKAWVVI